MNPYIVLLGILRGVPLGEGVAEDRECGLETGGDFPLIMRFDKMTI